MLDFRDPLLNMKGKNSNDFIWPKSKETNLGFDVLEGGRIGDREANEEDLRIGETQGPQTIVFFLPSSIPELEMDSLAIDNLK